MIKNLTLHNETVTKKLVINKKTGAVAPVGRVDKSPLGSKNTGTYQECSVGDCVLVSTSVNGLPDITLHVIVDASGGKSVPAPAGTNLFTILHNLNQIVLDWLTDYTDTPFLPKGCGWDGKYSKADLIKSEKLIAALPSDLNPAFTQRLLNAALFTSDKIVGKTPERCFRSMTPKIEVDHETYSHCILEYSDHSTLVHVTGTNINIEVVDDLKEVILIGFIQLKVKDNEQFIWKRLRFDSEV